MFAFLLIVQSLVALSLITVILMQRSEGGGLGVGGSSSGFMTARGAADFLTRATSILGTIFIVLAIAMAAIAGATHEEKGVDTSLANSTAPTPMTAPQPATPGNEAAPATGDQSAPAQNKDMPLVPLAQ